MKKFLRALTVGVLVAAMLSWFIAYYLFVRECPHAAFLAPGVGVAATVFVFAGDKIMWWLR